VHAIVSARIVVAPGQVIPRGTVVMRDGIIAAVGPGVKPPADARIWRGDSLTVYAGLVDAYVLADAPPETGAPAGPGSGRGRPGASAEPEPPRGPEHELEAVRADARAADLVPLGKETAEGLRAAGFTAAGVVPRAGVLRGQSALALLGAGGAGRQLLRPSVAQVAALEPPPRAERYPASLMGVIAVIRQAFSDARWYAACQAAWARAPQGHERPPVNRALDALGPAARREQPVLFVCSDVLGVLRAGVLAREFGVSAQAVGAGDEYKRVNEVRATGLPLVVPVDFPDPPDVADADDALEVSTLELRSWYHAPENPAALERAGVTFALTTSGLKDAKSFREKVRAAIQRGLSGRGALAAVTTVPARLLGAERLLGTIEPGKVANLTVTTGDLFDEKTKVREVWVDGDRFELEAAKPAPAGGTEESARAGGRRPAAADSAGAGGVVAAADTARIVTPRVAGDPEAWRAPRPEQPGLLLVKNATIWTCGPQGTLEGADLIVRAGKIAAVGRGLSAPGARVVDATGEHVIPGILDPHSHTAILGDVNECTNSVTAEVRIADVINSESPAIYRELAGGVTAIHALHGSCNPIGGQCALLKLRWGEPPDALRFEGATPTLKFALGENVKQSNSDDRAGSPRYPQTRAGVEQIMRETFLAGRDYRREWEDWRAGRLKGRLPPRRDFQLEAINEVLDGKRLVHAHAYRQDEILALMRLAERFGFRVGTFGHVLEGYKVADEMAAHGAAGSTSSDWWGYKYEALDAIPYNGCLMWDRGVSVSYNSDSDELARRLNTEAAKAVKYGGVPEEEALKFVTLNPARELHMDHRVGSLEPGKDADFSIWNGSPLSPLSRCEQTWVDGRKYFDREADLAGREALAREREQLIARAQAERKRSGGPPGGGERRWPPRYLESQADEGQACLDCARRAEGEGR
jgi:imidazolonepropionase-like amidohydrolase